MREFARPVSRDNFFYSGSSGIYVEVDRHRHSRADSYRLYSLLTYVKPDGPALTKAGKVAKHQPLPRKDEPAHFYTAQLIHYGLKAYKTKEPAKKHLLAAFDKAKKLAVPPHILQIERELKAEWERDNAIAERKYEEEKEQQRIAQSNTQKKIRQDFDAFMEDVGVASDDDAMEDVGIASDDDAMDGSGRQELIDQITALSKKDLQKLLGDLMDELPEVEDVVEGLIATHAPEPSASNGKRLGLYDETGEFKILCPYLSSEWPDYAYDAFTLRLAPSSTKSHLWGAFKFGIIKGVVRSTSAPPKTSGTTIKFFWRGREAGEDEMTYGKSNTMSITFLGNGKIKGVVKGSICGDKATFGGSNVKKQNIVWTKYVKRWKEEWRSYNNDTYEAENAGRWGK